MQVLMKLKNPRPHGFSKVLGLIGRYERTWNSLVFYLAVALNIILIVGHSRLNRFHIKYPEFRCGPDLLQPKEMTSLWKAAALAMGVDKDMLDLHDPSTLDLRMNLTANLTVKDTNICVQDSSHAANSMLPAGFDHPQFGHGDPTSTWGWVLMEVVFHVLGFLHPVISLLRFMRYSGMR